MEEGVKKLSWTSRMIDFGGQMTMHHQWLPLIVYKEENATQTKKEKRPLYPIMCCLISYNFQELYLY
jgi:hypothetical protein